MTRRMPLGTASRLGVEKVVAAAADERIIITEDGQAIAMVSPASAVDRDAQVLREGVLKVLDSLVAAIWDRSSHFSLEEVCERLGIDYAEVQRKARALAQSADDPD